MAIFSLWLNDDNHEDYLSLGLAMENIQFTDAPKFVPYHEVGSGLHGWLTKSLVSGVVGSGIYWGYGSIESNDAINSFTSSLLINTKDGSLNFDDEWPNLEKLNAELVLQNERLNIVAPGSSVAGTELTNIIANLDETPANLTSILKVASKTKVSPDQIKYWLEESPISDQTKVVSDQIDISGDVNVDIELNIPVSDGDDNAELAYKVTANLDGNRVEHPDSNIVFNDVLGLVEVSSKEGVVAENIKLNAFGHNAVLGISTAAENEDKAPEQFIDFSNDSFESLSKTVFTLNGDAGI